MGNTLEQVRPDLPAFVGPVPGPRARAVMERDARVVSPSYTRGYPLVAERGEGAIIEDVDGNRFLDFNAGIKVQKAIAIDIFDDGAFSHRKSTRLNSSHT